MFYVFAEMSWGWHHLETGRPQYAPMELAPRHSTTPPCVGLQGDAPTSGMVLRRLLTRPQDALIRKWNWKSALFSSLVRCSLFFVVNLGAGPRKAAGAMLTELVFRGVTAGWFGSVSQAFRGVRPLWKAVVSVVCVVALCQHPLELLVHWLRGTPRLAASVGASVILTAVSTVLELALMRKGALVVGVEGRPWREDLASLPRLVVELLKDVVNGLKRSAAGWQEEADPTN